MKRRILIIDSDRSNFAKARQLLDSDERDLFFLDDVNDAIAMLRSEPCDLVVIRENITASNTKSLMTFRSKEGKSFQVIILADHGTAEKQEEMLSKGAAEYLIHSRYTEALAHSVKTHLEYLTLQERSDQLEEQLAEPYSFANIVGDSESMQRVYELIRKVAPSNANALLQGESGTGKELVARAIHFSSPRKGERFIAVNCAAIPSELMESEFFGHIKGAFTGADRDKIGLFESAAGGTILLDEIDEVPYDLQSKLLRTLQEREIKPVGSARTVPLDIRLISASNRNLSKAVEQGRFRDDLLYRLNTIIIELPPLRERKSDIPLLVNHFTKKQSNEIGKKIKSVSDEAMSLLTGYDWPGNVRELENAIERAVILTDGDVLGVEDFNIDVASGENVPMVPLGREIYRMDYNKAKKTVLDEFAREYFMRLLDRSDWNISKAAKRAGIKRQSLHQILNRLKLNKNNKVKD